MEIAKINTPVTTPSKEGAKSMSFKAGRKRLTEAFDEISNSKKSRGNNGPPAKEGPLIGVVICLTGLTSHKKTRLHALVEQLGGR